MSFISHPLIKPETIEERDYQKNILETAKKKNTLVVLPTGTGKTPIAILLAAERLQKFPDSKILIMAPTRPLCAQHQKSFQETLNLSEEDIILLTGKIPPYARERLYRNAEVILATPQTIRNDILNKSMDLSEYSLLVIDECHRSVKRYAYPFVAKEFIKKSKNSLILGLTASPGGSEQKINEIRKNLFIDAVEIRTETDEDVKSYVKKIDVEWIKVDLPDEMKNIQTKLKSILRERIEKLKNYKIHIYTKKELLQAQRRIQVLMKTNRKPVYFHIISLLAETVKLWYIIELLETQSISSVKKYFDKLKEETSRASKRILISLKDSIDEIEKLYSEGLEHPKINKLKEIVSQLKDKKIIVFSHYRDNIDLIKKILENVDSCKPVILIGQSGERGMSQKEQIDIIRDYECDVYNCLITSPIGEEGLHIPSADIAIFYEPVPSEIRTIQRRGRVGRTKVGKIIFLLTKKTRDEGYYWIANRKEKKMKEILRNMQKENLQKDLDGFL